MQPVQILRNNAILEAADGDEEGQGTSQQKDAISGMSSYSWFGSLRRYYNSCKTW